MNVNSVKTRDYEDKRPYRRRQNKPKQTQFKAKIKPIKPNFRNAKMNVGSVKTKDYENKRLCGLRENKPNSNPISARADRTNKYLFLTSQGFTSEKLMVKKTKFERFWLDSAGCRKF